MVDNANRECLAIEVGVSILLARLIRVLSRLIDCYGPPAGEGVMPRLTLAPIFYQAEFA